MSSDPLGPTLLILITILIITWIMITYLEHKKVVFLLIMVRLHSFMKMGLLF